MRSRTGWGTRVLLAATALSLLPMAAEARKTAVDFPTGGEFANEGSSWEFPTTFYAPSQFPVSGSLEFTFEAFSGSALNIGGSSFTGFCMFEDGAFSLTQSGGGCSDASNALFSGLAGLDLVASDSATDPFAPGAVFISHGYSADRLVSGEPGEAAPYDLADARTALRFSWIDMALQAPDAPPAYSMQAFIYFLGDGDFQLDLRYAGASFEGASQLFSVNGNSLFSSSEPLLEGNDYFFCFTGGALAGCGTEPPPTNVPEPGPFVLLAAGLLSLALAYRRKLRRSA